MSTLRLRVTGPAAGVEALANALHGLDTVEAVVEVADLMPHMDDADSSSAGLPDDDFGNVHALEVLLVSDHEQPARTLASEVAMQQGLVLEFVDRF